MKRTATFIVLILSGILVALIILEIGARLFLPPVLQVDSNEDIYACSTTFGWTGRPNLDMVRVKPEFDHRLQFNSKGMYDTDHPLKKPAGTFRILWVGDSYAQAIQIPEPETAHQQLENLLNERLGARQFEIISMGVGSWGNDQELIYYREHGQHYQPDLVLLMFFVGNDISDNLPGNALTIDGYNCYAPYFPVCENGILDTRTWAYIPGIEPAWDDCSSTRYWLTQAVGFFQKNSYLFAKIEPLLILYAPRRVYGHEFPQPLLALYVPTETEEVRHGWQVTEGLLHQFNQEVQANHSEFAVAIIGPYEAVRFGSFDETQLQNLYQSDPILQTAEFDRPNLRLRNFLERQDIPVIDLQHPMTEYNVQHNTQLYLSTDRHWTAEGNRVVAEMLFDWLIDNGLVEE